MAISNQQAQEQYLAARTALETISRSRHATPAQKQKARRERDRLDLEFVGRNVAEVEARTAQFQTFITRMESLLADLESDALLRGMKGLNEVLAAAKPLADNES